MTRSEELRLIEESMKAGRVTRLEPASFDQLIEKRIVELSDRKHAGIKRYWDRSKAKQRKWRAKG